jgi:hypothetical protein
LTFLELSVIIETVNGGEMITKNAQALNRKANQCKVVSFSTYGVYRIKSTSGETYTVDLSRGGICYCAWGQRNGAGCSHEMAARKHWAALHEGRAASFQAGDAATVARQQHKTTQPVAVGKDGAMNLVLRDRDPLHGVVRFCESWDRQAEPTGTSGWKARTMMRWSSGRGRLDGSRMDLTCTGGETSRNSPRYNEGERRG